MKEGGSSRAGAKDRDDFNAHAQTPTRRPSLLSRRSTEDGRPDWLLTNLLEAAWPRRNVGEAASKQINFFLTYHNGARACPSAPLKPSMTPAKAGHLLDRGRRDLPTGASGSRRRWRRPPSWHPRRPPPWSVTSNGGSPCVRASVRRVASGRVGAVRQRQFDGAPQRSCAYRVAVWGSLTSVGISDGGRSANGASSLKPCDSSGFRADAAARDWDAVVVARTSISKTPPARHRPWGSARAAGPHRPQPPRPRLC